MLDVIEYYYAEFNSYFVTALADEIVKLDNGTFVGWARTGLQFKVHTLGTPGSLTVCRFYSVAFGLKSAHFYTPAADECARVKTNPDWIFEGEVFAVPSARADGSCGTDTVPVYRLYNNGEGGAPNHRYTTVGTVRDNMVAAGGLSRATVPGSRSCVRHSDRGERQKLLLTPTSNHRADNSRRPGLPLPPRCQTGF
jgi:hypothetical protein